MCAFAMPMAHAGTSRRRLLGAAGNVSSERWQGYPQVGVRDARHACSRGAAYHGADPTSAGPSNHCCVCAAQMGATTDASPWSRGEHNSSDGRVRIIGTRTNQVLAGALLMQVSR